ncbi:hypothetical protein NE865_05078 [Phthorimaea operculella]|nr:hypothetical protein NE865_05078 [Phthorimaea operculella]
MRYFYLLLLVGILTGRTFCRPPLQNVEESQGDEVEYEEEEEAADEAAEEDGEQRISLEDSDEQEENDMGKSINDLETAKQQMDRRTTTANEELSKHNKNYEGGAFEKRKTKDELQPQAEQQDINQFLSKTYVEDEKRISNRVDTNKMNNQKLHIDKLTRQSEPASNENSDVLFERSLQSSEDRINRNDFADENSQYHSKQRSNPVHESDPDFNKYRINLGRDRRDARDNAEDEETAIKNHVKKLSAQELKELLNTLSEDKRQLLIKIMGNEEEYNVDINKREITKKAGVASDVNSLVENEQSDVSKLQESGTVSEVSSNTASTEMANNKLENSQSSINVLPVTSKSADASNETSFSSLFTVKKVEIPKPMDTSNLADPESNSAPELKNNNKRETIVNQLSNIEGSFDEEDNKLFDNDGLLNEYGNFGGAEKDMSELDDELSESGFYKNNAKALKREASDNSDDTDDAVMSLEDSFPNANAYDDKDSEMAPLVRVKRKNLDSSVYKRSAEMASDSKVAYSKSAVKDTINSDGGNSDDGAQSNFEDDSVQLKLGAEAQTNLVNSDKSDRDVAKIGSDTDSVLSGGQGVDENLMFNSALRNKRTFAESKESSAGEEVAADEAVEEYGRPMRSTVIDEDIAVTQNSLNFNEKDSVDPVAHNFEGELGRFKRIRRVKPPTSPETEDI